MAGEAKAKQRARAEAEAQQPQAPDGLELRKDGTVLLFIDGELYRLRRPKIGEMRKLREGVAERDDTLNALVAEARAAAAEAKPAEAGEAQGLAEAAVDVAAKQTELNLAWLESAVRMLADREPPPTDEWPAGLEQTGSITALLAHWREVPLRSGAS